MRLLVGYLATSGGEDAVAVAAMIARSLGAQIDVCMILPSDRPILAPEPTEEHHDVLAENAQKWLAEAAATIDGDIEVATHVSVSDSYTEGLLAQAERLGAAAIVVGGSGGGLAGSLSLGSVVNELVHSSPVPVVLSPRGARDNPADRVHEVTCAIGTRPGARLLLDTALRVGQATGTPLRLVSLVAFDPIPGGDDDQSARERATVHAQAALDLAKSSLPEGFPVTAVVADGSTVEAAVNKLDWHDGDLIMVGSSRLAQPRRLFLGSTAAKMLRVLQVPMVVIPKEEGNEHD